MNTKNNRKSKLTRRIFHETLLDLLQTYHISEISVKRLCEAADLNRSTFYSYYENQMEILREIEEETYAEVHNFILSGLHPHGKTDSLLIFEQLLRFIHENPKLFRVLLGQNGSQDFQQKLMELTQEATILAGIDSTNNVNYYARVYRIAGCTRVIEDWIHRDFDDPVEEMAQLLIHLSAE